VSSCLRIASPFQQGEDKSAVNYKYLVEAANRAVPTMNGIEVTFDKDSLALKTEVMTLRDALDACRNTNEDLEEPTDDSSGGLSSVSQVRSNKGEKREIVEEVLYQEGATPLFKAIEEANWREALRITRDSPYQVYTWVKSTGTQNTTFDWSLWRRLPLHEVCTVSW
jgi:hypothetical protein